MFEENPLWIDKSNRLFLAEKITRELWSTETPYEIIGTRDIVSCSRGQKIWEMSFDRFKLFVESKIYKPVEVVEYEY